MNSKQECNTKHKPDERSERKRRNGDHNKTLEGIKLSIENLQSIPKEVGDLFKSVQFMRSNLKSFKWMYWKLKEKTNT